MIPPSSYMPPPGSQSIPATNRLTQQMQEMKLGQNSPIDRSCQPRPPGRQHPSVLSPQHMSTTVTYSGSPHVTYPYPNNPSIAHNPQTYPGNNLYNSSPPTFQSNGDPKVSVANSVQTYFPQPTTLTRNGISNGHEDMRSTDKTFSYLSPSASLSPQHPVIGSLPHTAPQVSPNVNPNFNSVHGPPSEQYGYQNIPSQHPGISSPPHIPPQMSPNANQNFNSVQGPPSEQYGYQNFPPQHPGISSPPQMSTNTNQNFNSMQGPPSEQHGFQNIPPQPPPVGFSSPQYSGVPPSPPSAGGMWPNQHYQQNSANYSYPPQHQATPQQQPMKLDLGQMPSTVQVREEDKKTRSGHYSTDVKGQPPPLVTTDFIVQDRGMCSPRFIRSSVYCLPNQPDMLKQTGLPFALTISPLASINEEEAAPPMCLFREQGPLRCKRCKAYICPFMTFMEGGRCFQCAFCKVLTEVPQDYFCFLDGMGERTDKYHRPELCLGSYEYSATKEYCRNDQMPNPPAYIFMIEVSSATFRNGLVPLLCENMKNVLQCLINDEQNDTSKLHVGFVTYNSVLHFYNMKKNLTQPHIMVLSDVHNAFVPLLDGFLVTLEEAEALVDGLMEHIPRLFINEPATEIILGPVIQVGLEALKNANCSGKLLIFHSTLPNADAPGKLAHREGQKLLGTEKQKTALSPQIEFYSKLAQECVAAGCAVDLFLFPSAYIDIASISPLCRHTGGQIYKYTYFQSHVDGDRFLEDLERNIVTPTAFDGVLRVRTSAGISPIFYYGNFYMSNTTDVELSAIDCHKAVTIELAYDDKLPENEIVYIQAALLYTTVTGERKIRVHNLALLTSVGMPDVFKCCELDTIINFFAKQAMKQVLELAPQQIKNNLVNRSVKILSCYRKHCASTPGTSQFILPDSLKLLPLLINCLLKSDAIAGGSDMSLDDRSFAMLAVNSMDVRSTAVYFYPTLIPLHDVNPDSDVTPSSVRCSIEKLNDNGAYLLENGIFMFLWIGQAISPDWLQSVFGVPSTNQLDKQKTSLPELNTPLSQKIRSIIEDLEEGRQWYMRLTVMVQGDKLEIVFRQFLVEDRGTDGSASYVDFICHLHREISKNL